MGAGIAVGAGLARDFFMLWNQEGADAGSFLFASKARSYNQFSTVRSGILLNSKVLLVTKTAPKLLA